MGLNRKVLSELAFMEPYSFKAVVETVKLASPSYRVRLCGARAPAVVRVWRPLNRSRAGERGGGSMEGVGRSATGAAVAHIARGD